MNVAELLAIPAASFPEQAILTAGGRTETYLQVMTSAQSMAARLRGIGVRPGDRVAVLDVSTRAAATSVYAICAIGSILVPLNFRARGDELVHLLNVASPRVVLCGAGYVDPARAAARSLDTSVVEFGALEGANADQAEWSETMPVDEADLAILMFTSGTSARPKAVMLGHGQLTRFVLDTAEMADGSDKSSALIAVPLHHIAGLTMLLGSVFRGRRVVLLPRFTPGEWLANVERERITHAFVVPTMLKRILEDPAFLTTDLSGLQVLSYGSAPMPLPVIRRALDRFPPSVKFTNAFGQTETTSTVVMLSPEDHDLTGAPAEVEQKLMRLSSVGRALPGTEIRILDDDGHALPPGRTGTVAIRTDRAMGGYYGMRDVTDTTLRDGWLMTSDLGWLDADGYLFLSGRRSDLIIRGGENIAPEEVETVIETHESVLEAAVVGVSDEEWGERILAVVVPRPGRSITDAEIVAYCRERLAAFKKPDRVVFAATLPRTSTGKLIRREVRERYAEATVGPSGAGP